MAAPDNLPNPETKGFHLEGPPPQVELQTNYQPITIRQRHAETANKLAIWLLAILGGTVVIHYACLMTLILCKRDDAAKILEDLFHSWLPVLAGLAGSAVTYYFTRNEK